MDTSLLSFLQEAIPAVAVVALMSLVAIYAIRPIVEKTLPIFDRAISVVEKQGEASIKLACVLENAMNDQRVHFELRIAQERDERLEQIAMLQKEVADLKEENAILKAENTALKIEIEKLRTEQAASKQRIEKKGDAKK
jgi:FtsZ-binding cell division protein ZapB